MLNDIVVTLPRPHDHQARFITSPAKRKVIRAGRRSGKTVGIAILGVRAFLNGRRVLYAAPTQEQIDRFWHEVKIALDEPIKAGVYYKNETRHIIELPGTEQRLRAKTAWNADSLRGDYADLLILDEWQLMNEDAWDKVGAPMLLDNDGDVVFIYTPPSPHSRSASKASDPRHAARMFKRAANDPTGRWEVFHFTSHDNPYISTDALGEIVQDMTKISYQMEIMAEDIDEVPGALWTMVLLDTTRVYQHPGLHRIVVGVDPQASTGQTGIVVVGVGRDSESGDIHGYTLDDMTPAAGVKPGQWAGQVVAAYHKWEADAIIGEVNNGGDMIEAVIRNVDGGQSVNYKEIRATRGKYTRAEPVAALFERGRGHMVGVFGALEDELISYVPGDDSPNRLDAMVWAYIELMGSVPPAGESFTPDLSVYKPKRKKSIWD